MFCLFESLGHRACGVDLASAMVDLCRRKSRNRESSIEFRAADAESLPFPDGTFDVVHARHLLWTLPRPGVALREWLRVLRAGGRLVVVESCWRRQASRSMSCGPRVKRVIGRLVTRVAAGSAPPPPPKRNWDYPGRALLPLYGGLDPAILGALLERVGLQLVRVQDLRWLLSKSRASMPWYWRWMADEMEAYHLGWGIRP
ncbi:MAG: class I SAM-dependent methyltransferase [Planctomycetota bacterium]